MKNPLVVGYKGEIGSFILNGLLRIMPKALDIWCCDINETEDEVAKRIQVSDVIFLCVPMDVTIPWLLYHEKLLKDKVIIEQCSLKEQIYKDKRLEGLNICAMHILFRPSQTPDIEDRKVAFFRKQLNLRTARIISEMIQSKVVLYDNAEEHDKEMAIQQALLHRTLLVMGKMLKECKGSTYIGKKVMELETRIRKGNKDLYKLIQANRHLPGQLKRMKKEFDDFKIEDYM